MVKHLIAAVRRQRQADTCKFQDSQVIVRPWLKKKPINKFFKRTGPYHISPKPEWAGVLAV